MAAKRFFLDWFAGASAQIEIFSPGFKKRSNVYQLKYTPPFRSTIRPPVEEQPLGSKELDPVNKRLDELFSTLDRRTARSSKTKEAPAPVDRLPIDQMKTLGNLLLDLIFPPNIQADLQKGGLFLEIGMDEKLLKYPWELMHDEENFLCLKHSVGRFVNGASASIPMQQLPPVRLGSKLDTLKILIISVPQPQERPNIKYDKLFGAEEETKVINETLSGIDGVKLKLLNGKHATLDKVHAELKKGYHIVHFNGHARFDDKNQRDSSLVLFDEDITTGAIARLYSRKPPLLCFINACETAKFGGWENRYDIFGLAEAFLSTDAYLLGSRWEINDKSAAEFAKQFYKSLIKDGKSLGGSILKGRIASKDKVPNDEFGWASYVFYGDPRVCFRKL